MTFGNRAIELLYRILDSEDLGPVFVDINLFLDEYEAQLEATSAAVNWPPDVKTDPPYPLEEFIQNRDPGDETEEPGYGSGV